MIASDAVQVQVQGNRRDGVSLQTGDLREHARLCIMWGRRIVCAMVTDASPIESSEQSGGFEEGEGEAECIAAQSSIYIVINHVCKLRSFPRLMSGVSKVGSRHRHSRSGSALTNQRSQRRPHYADATGMGKMRGRPVRTQKSE